jgi:hypothetical protein
MSKSKPVPITEIGWVPLYATGKGAMLTAHVTREYVEEEFDEMFGSGKWSLELTPLSGAMKARVTNLNDGSFREGVGISSDFKTKAIDVKASSTDAIKRCGTNWGVARGLSWLMWWPWVEQNKYGKYEPCEPPNTKGFENLPQTGAGKIDFYSRFLKQFFGIESLSGYGTINAGKPTVSDSEEDKLEPVKNPPKDAVAHLKKLWKFAQKQGDTSVKFKEDWMKVALAAVEQAEGNLDTMQEIFNLATKNLSSDGEISIKFKVGWAESALAAVEQAEGDLDVMQEIYSLVVKNLGEKSKTAKKIQSLLA